LSNAGLPARPNFPLLGSGTQNGPELARRALVSRAMPVEATRNRRRAFIWAATGLAVVVAGTCLAVSDSVLSGAIAATRNTARLSGLVMCAAVLARAPRPVGGSRWRTELTLAFVAAHGVHYATVVLRALVEPGNALRSPTPGVAVVVLAGLGLLAVLAATARLTSPAGQRANAITLYLAWAVLALASATRARSSGVSAGVLAALLTAMLWRLGSRALAPRTAR